MGARIVDLPVSRTPGPRDSLLYELRVPLDRFSFMRHAFPVALRNVVASMDARSARHKEKLLETRPLRQNILGPCHTVLCAHAMKVLG
jgi:hypothetical protein